MQLRPFTPLSESDPLSRLGLEGTAEVRGDRVHFRFDLQGDTSAIRWPEASAPAPGSPAARADELWKSTCFEAFIGRADGPGYFEFNISSFGRWNCYRFDRYREGMRPESAIQSLAMDIRVEVRSARISWSAPASAFGSDLSSLEIGMTAVIEGKDGNISYWAISHVGPKPDFHLRESFVGGLTFSIA